MFRFVFTIFGSLFALATLGAILGAVLLTGIFFAYGSDLPDHEQLATYEPATISRVYSSGGTVMDEFAQERRLFTPADEIPETIKHAFISAEDKNFYTHEGYDLRAIAGAIYARAKRTGRGGASTITQQVAKNFLLDGSQTIERKIKEVILASRIESTLSKDKILELYLNEISLGRNAFGVTAAAETYFGKSLEQLDLAEIAYLAALPKAPSNYHPVRNKKEAIARRNNHVLSEMAENEYISEEDMVVAKAQDLLTVQSGDLPSKRAKRQPRSYFTDEIRRQLSASFGEEEFFTGGLAVRATMDQELQAEAAKALQNGLEKYDRRFSPWRGPIETLTAEELTDEGTWREALRAKVIPRDIENWHAAVVLEVGSKSARIGIEDFAIQENQTLSLAAETKWARNREYEDGNKIRIKSAQDMWTKGDIVLVKPLRDKAGNIARWSLRQIPQVQGGFMAMDTDTGRVLAMQGGFSYQHSVFNRATQALRQPGSVFKPFVYAAALDSGYSPVSIIVDAPIEINTPQGLWRPKNASNKFYGPAPLRVGIEQSRNLMTIRLAQDVGMGTVAGYAERFGVYDRMLRVLSGALGSQESTLFRVVSAYAMFANGGERVEPTLVDRVQDRFGKTIYRHDQRECLDCTIDEVKANTSPRIQTNRERVMDPVTAYRITSFMRGVVDRGTATNVQMGVPIAGKTGTTNDAKDVWFVGFSRNIVAGCYMGYDTPKSLGKKAFGGTMCGPVFKQFMQKATKKYGAGKFRQPQNTYFAKFDRVSGARLENGASGDYVIAELFRNGEDPIANGLLQVIDGGFSIASNIEIFSDFQKNTQKQARDTVVRTSDGKTKTISGKASFGSLSSGGLY